MGKVNIDNLQSADHLLEIINNPNSMIMQMTRDYIKDDKDVPPSYNGPDFYVKQFLNAYRAIELELAKELNAEYDKEQEESEKHNIL